MEFYEMIGKRIRERRKDLGIRQEGLANDTDLAQSVVSKVENGRHACAVHVLVRICIRLGLSIESIVQSEN